MENSTSNKNFTSTMRQESTSMTGTFVFAAALNIFLSITASLGNASILIALRKVSSIHPPTKLLFRYLAATDLCVGLLTQPLSALFLLAKDAAVIKINLDVLSYFIRGNYFASFVFCGVSISTSTALSVDRLLAVSLGLRYRHVVTLRRVHAVIISLWLFSVLGGFMSLWSLRVSLTGAIVWAIVCLFISLFSYTKIFFTLRQRQCHIHDHVQEGQPNSRGTPLNIARYKKTVSSIAWVQLALVSCYVPFAIVAMFDIYARISLIAWHLTLTLFYLNSSLNPIVYCWRIREVRLAMKDTVKQFICPTS